MKKTKRPLSGYRVFKQQVKVHKKAYLALFLYAIALVYYALEYLEFVDTRYIHPQYLLLLSIVFVLWPLLHIHLKKGFGILLTHDVIAMQNVFNRYRMMFIQDIQKAKLTKKNTLYIKGKGLKFKIKMPHYEDNLNVIKSILNYEGHFKQKKKPYKLFFEVDQVDIQEMSPSVDPTTRRLLDKFLDDYKHLTPGFIKDVILYNASVEKVRFIEERHALLYMSHVDLKGDYPENTSFDAQKTDNALVVFQDVSHVEIYNIGREQHEADIELLGTSISTLRKIAKNAIVMETNFKVLGDRISTDMVIMQGAKKQRVRFVFKEIIIGFNTFKGASWFEKK